MQAETNRTNLLKRWALASSRHSIPFQNPNATLVLRFTQCFLQKRLSRLVGLCEASESSYSACDGSTRPKTRLSQRYANLRATTRDCRGLCSVAMGFTNRLGVGMRLGLVTWSSLAHLGTTATTSLVFLRKSLSSLTGTQTRASGSLRTTTVSERTAGWTCGLPGLVAVGCVLHSVVEAR